MSEKRQIKVVAALIEKDGRFFAAESAYGFLTGKWEFPGGKVEQGETPQEALKREIKEELSTDIEVREFVCNVIYEYPDFILNMDVFHCFPIKGRLNAHEGIHLKERFFALAECKEPEWCPADWVVIQKVFAKPANR